MSLSRLRVCCSFLATRASHSLRCCCVRSLLRSDVKRYNVHDVTSVIRRYNANPNEDLFVKEKEAAAEASKNLRGDKSGQRTKKRADKSEGKDAKEEAAPTQSWGSWIKSKVVGSSTPVVAAAAPAKAN
jgi:hypothetical protein